MKNNNLKQEISDLKVTAKVLKSYIDRFNYNDFSINVILERIESDFEFKEIMLSLQTILEGAKQWQN